MSRAEQRSSRSGVLWVAAGAALWGTDTVFRAPLTQVIGPTHIVLYEHLILSLVVLPIVIRHRGVLRHLGRSEWLAVLGISWIGSAAATVLFTYAIQAGNPTTAVLLQKLQPLFAMTLAWRFLGERWSRKFPYVVVGALFGGYLISFGGANLLDPLSAVELRPALLAMTAALGWGSTTVLGRWMVPKVPFTLLTGLRVVCAVPLLTLFSLMETPVLPRGEHVLPLVFLALVPGFAGLMLYYRGLGRTPAFRATVAELAFPATAALLNWTFLGAETNSVQLFGFTLVWLSIVLMRTGMAIARTNPATDCTD